MRVLPLACLAVLLLLAGCASPRPVAKHGPMVSWDVGAFQDDAVRLRKPDGSVAASFTSAQIRQLKSTKRAIERAAGYPDEAVLLLTDAPQPNAFAGTSREGKRFIAITLPMMNALADDAGALAHLLGHELAHHVKGHGKASRQRESMRRGLSVVFGTLLTFAGIPLGSTLADVGTQAVAKAYSREQEREADELGFAYAVSAGQDAHGAVRLFEKLSALSGEKPTAFLSTHPSSAERVENMRRLIEARGASPAR